MYKTIEIEIQKNIANVFLNRPKVRNALNEDMISELIDCFKSLNKTDVRAVVFRGKGKVFCAGADINWMKNVANYSYEQNYSESLKLANCFNAIYTCNKPVIAAVHGAAFGGANGLFAACDIVYADNETLFSFSEVKIGIIPATISPYIIKRIGEFNSKELMLTGKKFKGNHAERIGLINKSVDAEQLDEYVNNTIKDLLTSAPMAVSKCKELVYNVCNDYSFENSLEKTAKIIADIRATEEGQEGMASFLEKRKANWRSST